MSKLIAGARRWLSADVEAVDIADGLTGEEFYLRAVDEFKSVSA